MPVLLRLALLTFGFGFATLALSSCARNTAYSGYGPGYYGQSAYGAGYGLGNYDQYNNQSEYDGDHDFSDGDGNHDGDGDGNGGGSDGDGH